MRPQIVAEQDTRQIEVHHVAFVVIDLAGGLGVRLCCVPPVLLEALLQLRRLERETHVALHRQFELACVVAEDTVEGLAEARCPVSAERRVRLSDRAAHIRRERLHHLLEAFDRLHHTTFTKRFGRTSR